MREGELYNGWNWADVVSDMGYVRTTDTVVAQPPLDLTRKEVESRSLGRMARQGPTVLLTRDTGGQKAFHENYIKGGPAGLHAPAGV